MQEILGLITAVSHVTNITKSFVQAHNEAQRSSIQIELNGAMLDLQGKLGTLQMSFQTLLDSNASLKKDLAKYERWEQERSRYALKEPEDGVFVYQLKAEHAAGEPIHWLCAQCFQCGKKSILQRAGDDLWLCVGCNHSLDISEYPR